MKLKILEICGLNKYIFKALLKLVQIGSKLRICAGLEPLLLGMVAKVLMLTVLCPNIRLEDFWLPYAD